MAYGKSGNASNRSSAHSSRSSRSVQSSQSSSRRSSGRIQGRTQSRTQSSRVSRSTTSSRSSQVLDRMAMRPIFGSAAPQLQPEYESDVRVIRPERVAQTQQQPSLLPTLVKMAAVLIVVVAALSFFRIMLTSNAVVTMIENETISSQISEARSTGISLEMEQSVLKNPSAIRAQAKQMNMSAPLSSTTITLKPDIVAIENGATLSLSGTIKNVVQINQ